jgi:hypothetical protein
MAEPSSRKENVMLPGVNETIRDGGLGIISAARSGIFGLVGNASLGTAEQIYILGDPATAENTLEAGTLLEAVLDAFANGASKIIAVKTDPTGGTAAANGTVTHKTGGTSTGTCTVTGTPKNDRSFKVVITSAGATGGLVGGGVKIKISKNGGISYGDPITLSAASPQTISLGNGTSVVLTDNGTPAGSFVLDDYWTWSCTEAKPTNAKLLDAAEIAAQSDEIEWIHVSDETDSTLWAALSTLNATLETGHKYIGFMVEAIGPTSSQTADQWVAAGQAAIASYFDDSVMVVKSYGILTDRNGEALVRNCAGNADGLLAQAKVHQSIGWVGGFPVNNMLSLYPADITDAHIDTLDEARYMTFRFWPGHGFRCTHGKTAAPLTSDFQFFEFRRTLNKGVKLVRMACIPFVESVADKAGLVALQKMAETPLDRMKADGEVDGYGVLIPSGQDITGTGQVRVQVTIVVKGIMRTISLTFGLAKASAA